MNTNPSNSCNNCTFFNPIGRCEELPPNYDLFKVKRVSSVTPACTLFVAGEHYSITEAKQEGRGE